MEPRALFLACSAVFICLLSVFIEHANTKGIIMANNVSRKGNMSKNINVWTAEQQNWLNEAKAGNEEACGKLFESMSGLMENVHRYSQDGLHPKNFGYGLNYNGRTYEEASGDIYGAFCNAVERFDSTIGVPFGAYAVNEIRRRAMDWTRNRQNDRHVTVGKRLGNVSEDGGESAVLSDKDYESAVNEYYSEKSNSLFDSETHPVEYCEIKDMICKIRRELVLNGNARLVDFMELYLEYGGEKGAMDRIAERMGVARAMAYNYLGMIRELIVPMFGRAA